MSRQTWTAALALTALLTACTSAADPSAEPSAPAEGTTGATAPTWDRATPAQAGFDPGRLSDVVRDAQRKQSSCFVVVREGELVVEEYWRDGSATEAMQGFSVTKSVASTLIGMAQDRGLLDIDQSAARYVEEWRGTPAAKVTIRDLLSNDSGREWSPKSDYSDLLQATDQTAYAVGLGQAAPPDQVWAYNNSAIQTLDRVLREATGRTPEELAAEWLFEPLGMTHSSMSSDRSGNSTGTFSGLLTTCLDAARFGMLYAQGGKWEGEQLVSRGWVREAVGAPSQRLNAAYGLLWWLNRWGPLRGPFDRVDAGGAPILTSIGRMVPEAPADAYAALGFGGQVVAVDPGSQTVVVRLGNPVIGEGLTAYTFGDAARVLTYASR